MRRAGRAHRGDAFKGGAVTVACPSSLLRSAANSATKKSAPYNVYGMTIDSAKRFWFYGLDAPTWNAQTGTQTAFTTSTATIATVVSGTGNITADAYLFNTTLRPFGSVNGYTGSVTRNSSYTITAGSTANLPAVTAGTLTLPAFSVWQQENTSQWYVGLAVHARQSAAGGPDCGWALAAALLLLGSRCGARVAAATAADALRCRQPRRYRTMAGPSPVGFSLLAAPPPPSIDRVVPMNQNYEVCRRTHAPHAAACLPSTRETTARAPPLARQLYGVSAVASLPSISYLSNAVAAPFNGAINAYTQVNLGRRS